MPLESSFCTSCPVMSLAGVRVRHPWISDRHSRVTGYDPIQSENVWVSSGITLGEAVHAVVKHLQLNPPEILEIMDKGLLAIQTKKQQPSSSKQKASQLKNGNPRNERSARADAPPSYNVFANLPEAPDIPMPAIPKSYPVLDDLSREELDRLMEDELEFLSLVHKVEAFHQIQSIRNEKLDDNVTLAKANLENESQLKAAQEEVGKLQKTLKEKVSSFQQLESKQNALCAPPDTQSVIRQLNKASQQAMDDSEALAEDWVENGGDVAKFFKDFIAQRKVYHVREAKMERLQRQNIKEI